MKLSLENYTYLGHIERQGPETSTSRRPSDLLISSVCVQPKLGDHWATHQDDGLGGLVRTSPHWYLKHDELSEREIGGCERNNGLKEGTRWPKSASRAPSAKTTLAVVGGRALT